MLMRRHGIRFADVATADRFSFEMKYPKLPTFGFHGIFNFAFTESATDLAALAPQLSDRLLDDIFVEYLLRNCELVSKWQAIIAIGHRILARDRSRTVVRELLNNAQRALDSGGG
jgi:hypothetical protein